MVQIKRDNMPVTCRDMQGHAGTCRTLPGDPEYTDFSCRFLQAFPGFFFSIHTRDQKSPQCN